MESFAMSPKVPLHLDPRRRFAVARLHRTSNLPEPGQSIQIDLSYEMIVKTIDTDVERAKNFKFEDYQERVQKSVFLKPETKVEILSPDIRKAAEKLRDVSKTPWETAQAVYHWILEKTEYQLIEGFGGARYCLTHRHGECGDYSALFVALCRVLGIPARGNIGAWVPGTNRWHVWAEFMLPNGDWIPVDLSVADDARFPERHFGMRENNSLILTKSFDIVLPKVKQGQANLKFLQTGAFYYHAQRLGETPTVEFELVAEKM
jgi:hypothetical protein